MKTIRTFFAVFIATFTVSVAMGSGTGNLKVTMEPAENNFTVVEVSSVNLNNFEIALKNAYGQMVYSMKTQAPTNRIKKKYDFSNLDDGIYWYSVKMDKQTTTKRLEIDNGDVEVLEIKKSVEPTFIYEGKMLKVSYLNPQKENAKVYIYDSSNNLLTEAEIGSDFAIHKAIDFSDKGNGSYEVVIANGMELYEYTVSIE